jgi:hypothetical protein
MRNWQRSELGVLPLRLGVLLPLRLHRILVLILSYSPRRCCAMVWVKWGLGCGVVLLLLWLLCDVVVNACGCCGVEGKTVRPD